MGFIKIKKTPIDVQLQMLSEKEKVLDVKFRLAKKKAEIRGLRRKTADLSGFSKGLKGVGKGFGDLATSLSKTRIGSQGLGAAFTPAKIEPKIPKIKKTGRKGFSKQQLSAIKKLKF